MPNVRARAASRSAAAAASTSPTLAPCIQTSGPCGRRVRLTPRRSPIRAGSSLPCFSRRLISAGASGTTADDSRGRRAASSAATQPWSASGRPTASHRRGGSPRFRSFSTFRRSSSMVAASASRRHEDRLRCRTMRAAAERQIDGGAVPIVQPDEAAGRHRERDDRPSGLLRQHDDAEPRDARALRHVGSRARHYSPLERLAPSP